jgi:hypothetical protein
VAAVVLCGRLISDCPYWDGSCVDYGCEFLGVWGLEFGAWDWI